LASELFTGPPGYKGIDGGRTGHFVVNEEVATNRNRVPCRGRRVASTRINGRTWIAYNCSESGGAAVYQRGHTVLSADITGTRVELSLHGHTKANLAALRSVAVSLA
jgi:hypothetical protein